MKKIVVVVAFIVILCAFTGCGKATTSTNESNTKSVEDISSTKDKVPTETQIKTDINNSDLTKFKFNNIDYVLDVDCITVKKADINNGDSTIYCEVEQKNDDYMCKANYVLKYHFYEVGGWVLDSYDVTDKNVEPTNVVPDDVLVNFMEGDKYKNITKVSKSDSVKDGKYCDAVYTGEIQYAFMTEVYSLNLKCEFNSVYGWVVKSDSYTMTEDWSKSYKTWVASKDKSTTIYTCEITIESVDYANLTCTYSYKFSSSNSGNYVGGETYTDKMQVKNTSFENKQYEYFIQHNFISTNSLGSIDSSFSFALGKYDGVCFAHADDFSETIMMNNGSVK